MFFSVPPVFAYEGFPTTKVLDDFNRADGNPPPGTNWTASFGGGFGGWKIRQNTCAVDAVTGGLCADYWNADAYTDAEGYVTVVTKPENGGYLQVIIRTTGEDTKAPDGYSIDLSVNAGPDIISLLRSDKGVTTTLRSVAYEIKNGDKIGISVVGNVITGYIHDGKAWFELVSATDGTYPSAGVIGLQTSSLSTVIDDFGGGTRDVTTAAVYRSVGPGETQALAKGNGNTLTIAANAATFTKALDANIGIGDAVAYDADGDSDIDDNDAIAFLHGRISATSFILKTAGGSAPRPVVRIRTWAIYRAYTSLANAESGIENSGIHAALRNFDDWTAGGGAADDDIGRDLQRHKEQWNIVCYADGGKADAASVTVDGWATSPENFLNIATPTKASAVGTSQRHNGIWSASKYKLALINAPGISIIDDNVHIDGLQVELQNVRTKGLSAIFSSGAGTQISNCIIRYAGRASDDALYGISIDDLGAGGSIYQIWNNIVYGFGSVSNVGMHFNIRGAGSTAYLYNNTVYGCTVGYKEASDKGQVVAVNNISYNNGDNFSGTWHAASGYNLSGPAQNDAPGANPKNGAALAFISLMPGSENLHLSPDDQAALSAGTNLGKDLALAFSDDIDGETRPAKLAWDIGADENLMVPEITEEVTEEAPAEEAAPAPVAPVPVVAQPPAPAPVKISDTTALNTEEKSVIKSLIEPAPKAGAKSYDVVIKLGDNIHPDPKEDARGSYKEGDVVVALPTGHEWAENEKRSFLIVQMYLTDAEAADLVQPATVTATAKGKETVTVIKRRARKIDLKQLGLDSALQQPKKLEAVRKEIKGKALKKDKVVKTK